MLDNIDPTDKYFCVKLYSCSCIRISKGTYAKDIRIFNTIYDTENLFIVDDISAPFRDQLPNRIPIISYSTEQETDRELVHLLRYLRLLSRSKKLLDFN